MKITDEQWSMMSRACEGSEFEDVQFILGMLRAAGNEPIDLALINEALIQNGLPRRKHSYGIKPAYGYTIPRFNTCLRRSNIRLRIGKVGHIRGEGTSSGLVQIVAKLR